MSEPLTSYNQIKRDGLAAEPVDPFADDYARVADPDRSDFEVPAVQAESLAPSPLDHAIVLKINGNAKIDNGVDLICAAGKHTN